MLGDYSWRYPSERHPNPNGIHDGHSKKSQDPMWPVAPNAARLNFHTMHVPIAAPIKDVRYWIQTKNKPLPGGKDLVNAHFISNNSKTSLRQ